jgi:uncharacterized protein YndB with AHSA1/START domain
MEQREGANMSTTDRIERETTIAAPVDRVWALLTEAEHVGAWFGDAGAEIDLRPGGAMAISWEKHGTVRARVERVEPHRLFSYRWGSEMGAEPEDGASTLVEFTLEPDGDGTLLRVVESGFASLDVPADDRERRIRENTGGWEEQLRNVAEYARSEAAARR